MNKQIEWISLNFISGIYIVKDWLMLNIGNPDLLGHQTVIDDVIKYMIGLSIVAFNIIRIWKYISERLEKKEQIKLMEERNIKKDLKIEELTKILKENDS